MDGKYASHQCIHADYVLFWELTFLLSMSSRVFHSVFCIAILILSHAACMRSLPSVIGRQRHTRAANLSPTVTRVDVDRRVRRSAVGFGRARCWRRPHVLVRPVSLGRMCLDLLLDLSFRNLHF